MASTSDAEDLSKALEDCNDSLFLVDWVGLVIVETTLNVSARTSLTITGDEDLSSAVDGGGTTQLFFLEDAGLNLTNIALINGHADRGAAIHARNGSKVHLDGGVIFAHNHAKVGAAISVESSPLSWCGNVTFINNTVDGIVEFGADGGALHISDSNVSASGTSTFLNNSAGEDGGAVRTTNHGNIYFDGNTSFVDNRALRHGGALMATDDSSAEFLGTTLGTHNSAGSQGGAFWLGGDTRITSTMTFNGDTVISDNSAGEDGGAIFVSEECSISWGGSMTFSGNKAAYDGGAVSVTKDSNLSSRGTTLFRGNSAVAYGGAVYSLGNANGQFYEGAVFRANSAARGGAVATFSTGQESQTIYTSCSFRDNYASATGGAVEASAGRDEFINSLFWNNSAGRELNVSYPLVRGVHTIHDEMRLFTNFNSPLKYFGRCRWRTKAQWYGWNMECEPRGKLSNK